MINPGIVESPFNWTGVCQSDGVKLAARRAKGSQRVEDNNVSADKKKTFIATFWILAHLEFNRFRKKWVGFSTYFSLWTKSNCYLRLRWWLFFPSFLKTGFTTTSKVASHPYILREIVFDLQVCGEDVKCEIPKSVFVGLPERGLGQSRNQALSVSSSQEAVTLGRGCEAMGHRWINRAYLNCHFSMSFLLQECT